MNWIIETKTVKESEIWDNGWKLGLISGLIMGILSMVLISLTY